MNDVSLNPEIVELEAEMEYEMPQYPVIPNPEGEPTEEITKMEIDDVIYEVTDAEARATLPTKVDKVEGKGLSTNDYDNTDKAIVDGVTSALDGKVDKVQGKGLSTNDFTDEEKTIVDETPSALESKADKSDTYTKSEVDSALNNKVDKDGNKVLSDNNYSDTDKTKLDGIEAEANKTVVDNLVTSTSTNPVESKAIYNLLNDLLPEATATGNPIAITNASGLNAKSLKVELEPIQDLHGYDSPWVGGAGANKWDEEWESGSIDTSTGAKIASNTDIRSKNNIPVLANTKYYIKKINGVSTYVYFFNNNDDILQYVKETGDTTISVTNKVANCGSGTDGCIFTTPADCAYILLKFTTTSYSSGVAVNYPHTVTTYAPYSNICPISGRTQTTVSVNSEDTTIQFGQTVYGATVKSQGGTDSEWNYITIDSNTTLSGVVTSAYGTFSNITNIPKGLIKNDEICVISDKCVGISYDNRVSGYNDKNRVYVDNSGNVVIRTSIGESVTTVQQMLTLFNGFSFCYKLDTSTEISTPAFDIPLNKGNNTLTADGDMELIYSKTPQ